MTWFKAKEHCEGKGAKLVEINSEEENTALVDEINRLGYPEKKMHFWIGLTDSRSEGKWRLASSGLKPSYENWHDDQPDNFCARLRIGPHSSWTSTWSDINCNWDWIWQYRWNQRSKWTMHALCEFDSSTQSSSTEGTTTEDIKAESTTMEGLSTKS